MIMTIKEPFDGNFHPDLEGEALKEKYDFLCPKCGADIGLKPSIMMTAFGWNVGSGTCPKKECGAFFHLEINDTNDGANVILNDDYFKLMEQRKNEKRT